MLNYSDIEPITIIKTSAVGRTEIMQPGEFTRQEIIREYNLTLLQRAIGAFQIPRDLLNTRNEPNKQNLGPSGASE